MVEFVKRTTLQDVVRELVIRQGDGKPALVEVLAELSVPPQELMRSDRGGSAPGVKHSPAPWFAPAAELLDEMFRGAVRWHEVARPVLGWPPLMVSVRTGRPRVRVAEDRQWCSYPFEAEHRYADPSRAARDVAGRCALLALPGLVGALADAGSPLGVGHTVAGAEVDGRIGEQLRGWFRRACELTGRELPLERLPQVPNPDHKSNGGHRRIGPVCQRCSHSSCERIASGHRRSLPWLCEFCNSDTLRRDPALDVVVCIRPSCVNDRGVRPQWPVRQFDVAALDPWGDEQGRADGQA